MEWGGGEQKYFSLNELINKKKKIRFFGVSGTSEKKETGEVWELRVMSLSGNSDGFLSSMQFKD